MVSRVQIPDEPPHADVAKLADALDLGSSGRPWGFKSLHPHHCLLAENLIHAMVLLLTMGYRQAVRHKTLTLARASSNLATPANGGYSSVGRAPDCGSGCRGFKSLYPPQIIES